MDDHSSSDGGSGTSPPRSKRPCPYGAMYPHYSTSDTILPLGLPTASISGRGGTGVAWFTVGVK